MLSGLLLLTAQAVPQVLLQSAERVLGALSLLIRST